MNNISRIIGVVFAAAALLSSSSGFPGPTAAIGMTYGGECTYRPYEGTATVVSVLHREQISSTAETTYEVRFTFSPHLAVEEPRGRTEGREFLLLLDDSSYPDGPFLEERGIKEGRSFEGLMKVITGGTCSPQLFEIPAFRRDKR